MELNNVVKDEKGRLKNLRKDLPEECRYISQKVTVRKTRLVCDGPYLKFKMEFCEETDDIEINLSKIREVFSMMGVESQEDMQGKELICYSGIDGITWMIGSVKTDWVVDVIERYTPCKKENIAKYYADRIPPDKDWEAFCERNQSQE